ncbi:MAG: CPBP family intramembrane metalloprotease [Deltaproteobacteria bacterium]|nr:CPBP family intramembrane metalloprotease [Deltaproteobacteria bacterium]
MAVSFSFSWLSFALLRLWDKPTKHGAELLVASLLYFGTMGWQPLVALLLVRRWVDPSIGKPERVAPVSGRTLLVVSLLSLCLYAAATLTAQLLVAVGYLDVSTASPIRIERPEAIDEQIRTIVFFLFAFFATFTLVWLQALVEEMGWRSYFLVRLREDLGPIKGLLVHGAVWGLWYAPLVLVAGQSTLPPSWTGVASFTVTAVFLGVLLGWLRLRYKSVLPPTIVNSCLTLLAGLPFIMTGVDAGARGGLYGLPGLLPLGLLALIILLRSRTRKDLNTSLQDPSAVRPSRFWIVIDGGKSNASIH